jgi:hypothetical protein
MEPCLLLVVLLASCGVQCNIEAVSKTRKRDTEEKERKTFAG